MLTPIKEGQQVTNEIMDKYAPAAVEMELFDGEILPFYYEKEKFILMALYNLGLEKFVQILPEDSIKLLKEHSC